MTIDDEKMFYRLYSTISTEHFLLGQHMRSVGPENFDVQHLHAVLQSLHNANMLIVEHKKA